VARRMRLNLVGRSILVVMAWKAVRFWLGPEVRPGIGRWPSQHRTQRKFRRRAVNRWSHRSSWSAFFPVLVVVKLRGAQLSTAFLLECESTVTVLSSDLCGPALRREMERPQSCSKQPFPPNEALPPFDVSICRPRSVPDE